MDWGVFRSRAEAENTTLSETLDRYAEEVTPAKNLHGQAGTRPGSGPEGAYPRRTVRSPRSGVPISPLLSEGASPRRSGLTLSA